VGGALLTFIALVLEQQSHPLPEPHVLLTPAPCRFVRQLVDSRGDLGQLTTRKSRRREAAGSAGAGPGPGAQGNTPVGAVPSGSSDRAHSSMACDPPGPQQQQQSLSTGSGAHAMQASPSSHMAAAAAHAAGGVMPLDLPGSSGMQQQQHSGSNTAAAAEAAAVTLSPGPSSRRGEEAEAVSQALMRLGVLFQFQVYLYANDALRTESHVWTEALRSLMGSGSSSTVCMQVGRGGGRLWRMVGGGAQFACVWECLGQVAFDCFV
jgi:hypothetical protein